MRVLVAFASKHGATSEIAEAIAAALKERGVEADVKSIDAVTDPEAFDAVILGSAVYMGHWLDSAQAFAKSHQEQLTDGPRGSSQAVRSATHLAPVNPRQSTSATSRPQSSRADICSSQGRSTNHVSVVRSGR